MYWGRSSGRKLFSFRPRRQALCVPGAVTGQGHNSEQDRHILPSVLSRGENKKKANRYIRVL